MLSLFLFPKLVNVFIALLDEIYCYLISVLSLFLLCIVASYFNILVEWKNKHGFLWEFNMREEKACFKILFDTCLFVCTVFLGSSCFNDAANRSIFSSCILVGTRILHWKLS